MMATPSAAEEEAQDEEQGRTFRERIVSSINFADPAFGIPAVLTIEGADGANDRIHTAGDTLEHVDHDLALEILRMNVAYLVQALGPA